MCSPVFETGLAGRCLALGTDLAVLGAGRDFAVVSVGCGRSGGGSFAFAGTGTGGGSFAGTGAGGGSFTGTGAGGGSFTGTGAGGGSFAFTSTGGFSTGGKGSVALLRWRCRCRCRLRLRALCCIKILQKRNMDMCMQLATKLLQQKNNIIALLGTHVGIHGTLHLV